METIELADNPQQPPDSNLSELALQPEPAAVLSDDVTQEHVAPLSAEELPQPPQQELPGPPPLGHELPGPPPITAELQAHLQAQQTQAAQETRKRRNRWGDPKNIEPLATGSPVVSVAQQEEPPTVQTDAPSAEPDAGANQEGAEGTKRKRRSRWETAEVPETAVTAAAGALVPKFPKELTLPGGIKVVLPSHLTGEPAHVDPKLKALHDELQELNRRLLNNELNIPPEGQRSPSPEPIYDKNGIRLNTREIRYRERLTDRRQTVIEDLIKEDPNYKPPPDYKPRKYHRKIFIPHAEFPGYNFIGLIIGPRGNTQKRMQKETNTKIAIRGKGSVKEGASRDPKYDYGEDEELHVLITGDTQDDVNNAADMIEKLLEPVDEARNEHKRLQLRELAALNGTLKDDQACYLCGDGGHRSYECPKKSTEIYALPDDIKAKVDAQYQRDVARVNPEMAGKIEDEYKSFLAELGGAPPPELMGFDSNNASTSGAGRGKHRHDDIPDDCKLYVGSLSQSITDRILLQMFEPFGTVTFAQVLTDAATGASRGYGFVHFSNAGSAKSASDGMNGKVVDGRPLIVRLRSESSKGPGAGPRPDSVSEDCKLYVAYLPATITEQSLSAMFGAYGPVVDVRIIKDHSTGLGKGYAFISMGSPGSAAAAIRGLNGYKLEARNITVTKCKPASGQPQQQTHEFSGSPGHQNITGTPMVAQSGIMRPNVAPPAGMAMQGGYPPPMYGQPGQPPLPSGPPPPLPGAPYYPPPAYPGAVLGPPPVYAPPGPMPTGGPMYRPPYPMAAPSAPYPGYYPPPGVPAPAPALPPYPPPVQPPLPPTPPDAEKLQSDYEKFMSEMQRTFS